MDRQPKIWVTRIILFFALGCTLALFVAPLAVAVHLENDSSAWLHGAWITVWGANEQGVQVVKDYVVFYEGFFTLLFFLSIGYSVIYLIRLLSTKLDQTRHFFLAGRTMIAMLGMLITGIVTTETFHSVLENPLLDQLDSYRSPEFFYSFIAIAFVWWGRSRIKRYLNNHSENQKEIDSLPSS